MKGLVYLMLICPVLLSAQDGRGDMRFVFYNVENLFDPFDDSLVLDEEFLPGGVRHWTWERFLEKERKLYKVLASAGEWSPPELIGLCEIENRFVLNWLTGKTPLSKYNYGIIHKDSPDERGIDVALLYMPSRFRPLEWRCIPVTEEKTRDVLYVRGLVMERDTIHLLICHWPSRWEGYLESRPGRLGAARTVRQFLDTLFLEQGRPKILVAGDLNDELQDPGISSIMRIRSAEGLISDTCMYHGGSFTGIRNAVISGTIKYRGKWYEFDHIFASGSLFTDSSLFVRPGGKTIYAADFLLEQDPASTGLRPFRTYNGFKYRGGFSDHLPVYIDLWRERKF